jgi:hypothetical protein
VQLLAIGFARRRVGDVLVGGLALRERGVDLLLLRGAEVERLHHAAPAAAVAVAMAGHRAHAGHGAHRRHRRGRRLLRERGGRQHERRRERGGGEET